jgi:malonyl-CoA/methylmalonyl-CoA synthetase
MHALPIFHVHGLFVASHGALLNGSRMIWFSPFDPQGRDRPAARGHGVHGRAHAVCAHAGRARASRSRPAASMRLFISGSAPLLIETFNDFRRRAPATPFWNATA